MNNQQLITAPLHSPRGTDRWPVSRVEARLSPIPPTPNPPPGFTFIEVMAALAIFAIGFLAIAGLQTRSVHSSTHARIISQAMELADAQAEFFHALPFYPNFEDTALSSQERLEIPAPLAAGVNETVSGRFTVRSAIFDNTPFASVENIYTHPPVPVRVPVSKTIYITVFESANPGRMLASVEMIKVWEQDL